MDIRLNVNGFPTLAHFDDECVQSLFQPLLHELTRRQQGLNRRLIVFLAAPPGTGKSTLAELLAELSRQDPSLAPVQAVGMDGFHYPQRIILSRTVLRNGQEIPMRQLKGAPESFDVEKLHRALNEARDDESVWPYYDRTLHDVVENAVPITAPILLVEGNWLRLDAPEWASLPHDFSLFIDAEESQLRNRLIARKMRGGLSEAEAAAFYECSDGPNVRLCRGQRLNTDLRWRMLSDGRFADESLS